MSGYRTRIKAILGDSIDARLVEAVMIRECGSKFVRLDNLSTSAFVYEARIAAQQVVKYPAIAVALADLYGLPE